MVFCDFLWLILGTCAGGMLQVALCCVKHNDCNKI